MTEVPDWPAGTVAILATAGAEPHAIPVSTAVRSSEREVRFALGRRRGSLARLRADGRCALTVLAGGVAVTLHGRAAETGEAHGVVLFRLAVERVQDHDSPYFEIDDGVSWRWTDAEAERRDAAVREALAR
jgi:hypothetical protein